MSCLVRRPVPPPFLRPPPPRLSRSWRISSFSIVSNIRELSMNNGQEIYPPNAPKSMHGIIKWQCLNLEWQGRRAWWPSQDRHRTRSSGRNQRTHEINRASRCAAEHGADGASAPSLPRLNPAYLISLNHLPSQKWRPPRSFSAFDVQRSMFGYCSFPRFFLPPFDSGALPSLSYPKPINL